MRLQWVRHNLATEQQQRKEQCKLSLISVCPGFDTSWLSYPGHVAYPPFIPCVCCCAVCVFSRIWLSVTLRTGAYHTPKILRNFPDKNTGVNCHFLLQGTFPTQRSTHISCVSFIGGKFFTTEPPGKPFTCVDMDNITSLVKLVWEVNVGIYKAFEIST